MLWQVAEIQAVWPVPRLLILRCQTAYLHGLTFSLRGLPVLNPIHLAVTKLCKHNGNIWRQMRSVTLHPDAVMFIHVASY